MLVQLQEGKKEEWRSDIFLSIWWVLAKDWSAQHDTLSECPHFGNTFCALASIPTIVFIRFWLPMTAGMNVSHARLSGHDGSIMPAAGTSVTGQILGYSHVSYKRVVIMQYWGNLGWFLEVKPNPHVANETFFPNISTFTEQTKVSWWYRSASALSDTKHYCPQFAT